MTNNRRVAQLIRALLEAAASLLRVRTNCDRSLSRGRRFESCPAYRILFHDSVSSHPGECHYLDRWVMRLPWFSIRLHHWIAGDDQRNPHDHPWWFVSAVLAGSLREQIGDTWRTRRPLSVRWFPAKHSHCVDSSGCWTLLLTGPESRQWGFWVQGEWIPKKQYFRSIGHHQCD